MTIRLGNIDLTNKLYFGNTIVNKIYLGSNEIYSAVASNPDLIQLTSDNKGLILKKGLTYTQKNFATGERVETSLSEDFEIPDIMTPTNNSDRTINYDPSIESSAYPKNNATISNITVNPSGGTNFTASDLLNVFASSWQSVNWYLGSQTKISNNFILEYDTSMTNLHIGGTLEINDFIHLINYAGGSPTNTDWSVIISATVTDSNGVVTELNPQTVTDSSSSDINCSYNNRKWTITTETCTVHTKLEINLPAYNGSRCINIDKAQLALKESYVDYSATYYLSIDSFTDGESFNDTRISAMNSSSRNDLATFKLNESNNTIKDLTILQKGGH